MRKMLLLGGLVLSVSCAYRPQNQQGQGFDANSALCRQLAAESWQLYRQPRPGDPPLFDARIDRPGYVPVSDLERHTARDRYSQTCETLPAFNRRNRIHLSAG